MIIVIFIMIIVVIIGVNLAVKVFGFTPNQSRPNGSFNCERTAIAKAPFKDATKHSINGVMPWLFFEVVVETTMALDGEDGGEVEFTGFKSLSTTTMGAVGESRRTRRKRKG